MSKYKHILTDFKDLRKVIGEVTEKQPAKSRQQQQAEKMKYTPEAEAQPKDDSKGADLKKKKDHAGEDEIKKAYMKLGTSAQGSVEFQRKLIQKMLAKMGYKTYSKFAFDSIFKFESKQMIAKWLINEESKYVKTARVVVKTKGAKKVDGVLIDLFTASAIVKVYDAVNPQNKKRMDSLKPKQLADLAFRALKRESVEDTNNVVKEWVVLDTGLEKALQKFKVKFSKDLKNIDEGGMKRLWQDLENGATAQQISKKYGIDMKTAKSFVDDYKKVAKSPRLRAAENDPMKENIQEGTWAVPDSRPKLKAIQTKFLNKKTAATEINARKWAVGLYNLFGDDSFYDDLQEYMDEPNPKDDLRDVLVKHLNKGWLSTRNYKIDKIPQDWYDSDAPAEEVKVEGKLKRGSGRVKKPMGKMVQLKMSREDKLKEQKEHAKQSPFKLKTQQYPRAVAVDTDGFGNRHATVEDIIAACDSFGMIIDKELQVEQIQKQLGKKGFISFKQSELEDVFEERETQRMILALESELEEQSPIEYTKNQIQHALDEGYDIEFLKPNGQKTIGPVLKLSGNTFNVKDKYTGKSFTYKYSKIEEEKVKTFNEVINEGKFSKKLIKQAGGIAFDKRYYMGNMTGAIKAIEKLKKGLSDDPKVRDMLRIANEAIEESKVDEGKYAKYSDLLLKKARLVAQGPIATPEIQAINKKIDKEMKRLGIKEGTSAIDNWLPEGDKEAYNKFFDKVLKKFGVSSPDELEGEKKKEFFDYIDKNWKGDHEEVEKTDTHKSYKIDGRRANFREKMKKLGYIKSP